MKTYQKMINLTTKEWLDEWFNEYTIPRTRANTQVSYQRFVDVIKKYLGDIPLQELTSSDVQRVVFERYGQCFRSAQLLKVILTVAMNKAIDNGLIDKNPACEVELPGQNSCYVFYKIAEDDWQRLISARPQCFYWKTLFTLEYMTGMRRSELLGLKWKDICFKNGCINIRRALIIGKKDKKQESEHCCWLVQKPETEHAACLFRVIYAQCLSLIGLFKHLI